MERYNSRRVDPLNGTVNSTQQAQWGNITLMGSGTLIISASKAHCAVFGYDVNFNIAQASHHGWFILSEYTRDDPWNAVSNGYHSWLMTGATLNVAHTSSVSTAPNLYFGGAAAQVYNISSGQDLLAQPWHNWTAFSSQGSWTQWMMHLRPYTVNIVAPSTFTTPNMLTNYLGGVAVDVNKAPATLIYPLSLAYGNGLDTRFQSLFLGGNISAKSNAIFATKHGRGSTLDEIQLGDDFFSLLNFAGHVNINGTLAIRKV